MTDPADRLVDASDAPQAAAAPTLPYPRDLGIAEVVEILQQADRLKGWGELDLWRELADKLASIGRYQTATWLLREVYGRETADVCRQIAAEESGGATDAARIAHLEAQIDGLATVLMEEFGGPTQNESACEMAVRLLREAKGATEEV